MSIENAIIYLQSRNRYFESNANQQPLFIAEYDVSKAILDEIADANKTQEEKMQDIVSAYNKITQVAHYDGTGWFDFKVALTGYFIIMDMQLILKRIQV